MKTLEPFGYFFMGALVGVIICIFVLLMENKLPVDITRKARVEAVEHGHAHWKVSSDGSTKFEWNDPPCGDVVLAPESSEE